MLMLATGQKYEYQYVRGKNVPFQGAFALNNAQAPTEAPAQPIVETPAQSIPEAPVQPVAENLPPSAPEAPVQSTQGTPIESQNPSVSENQVQSSDLNNLQ